jgi:peptidyl-prolyl cis-trans isomerase D
VVTFLGGFVFLFGIGLDTTRTAQSRGEIGIVDGSSISRTDYTNAVNDQRAAFQKQNGSDADGEESRALETQAWRALVTQHLLSEQARQMGLKATDQEVVISLQSSPPAALAQAPAFQTNGQFDPKKYVAALRDPNNNWAPFEAQARQSLPVRKLQERMLASLKLAEPELRRAYRDRYENIGLTVVQISPSQQPNVPAPSDADVERVYQKYKSRFASGPRTQLELLMLPLKFTQEEIRQAREVAQGLCDRARHGEDFATLVKDYSEGPNAARGGEVNRVFQPHEFGPAMEAKMAALPIGGISDPFQDGPYWVLLKVLSRVPDPISSVPNLHVAQLAIRVRASENSMRDQSAAAGKIRDRAAHIGLGKAAAENGLSTSRTQPYDYNNTPPELVPAPEAADWGLSAKNGAVSRVLEGPEQFIIAQVVQQLPAGIPPKDGLVEQLRQIAQLEARIAIAKSQADQVAQALSAGHKLEDAARAAGATPFTVASMSRATPDAKLAPVQEVVGAAFAAPPGKTIGPIQTLAGWYFVRVDKRTAADPASFDQLKAQITQDIISHRQQSFFLAWLADLRSKAKVQDFRGQVGG